MEYRGVKIELIEGNIMTSGPGKEPDYVVSRDKGFVFAAVSRMGSTFATQPQVALDDAKELIDRKLGA